MARNWQAVVSSANGTLLAASVRGGGTYSSQNAGATWTELPPGLSAYSASLAVSRSTQWQFAAVRGSYLFYSPNYGANWKRLYGMPSAALWRSIACTGDGVNLAVAEEEGYVFTSRDRGQFWQIAAGGRLRWAGLAASADGSVLWASAYSTAEGTFLLLNSTNWGASWSRRAVKTAFALASSADGTKLLAAAWNGYLVRSVDGGTTWTALPAVGARKWTSAASSADGTMLAAAVYGGFIYTSADGGATWDPQQ